MSNAINKKATLKNLKKKGFTDSDSNSIDHHYLNFFHSGKLICFTKISHGGGKDITGGLINMMAKQIFLSKNDFIAFAKCDISQDGYVKKLKSAKKII